MQDENKVVLKEDNPGPGAGDPVARREGDSLDQHYAEKTKHNQFERDEDARNFIYRWFKKGSFLIALIMVVAVVIFSWHKLSPAEWRWLSTDDLDDLTSLGGGASIALLLSYLRRYL